MTDFHQRISADESASIWRLARDSGLLTDTTRSLLIHDLARMRTRIGLIHSAFPAGTLHALAIKANPLVEILREAVRAGCGLEAASIEELHLGLAAGCPADRIVFDSPAKTIEEIDAAVNRGVVLNADNFDELSRIDQILDAVASDSRIGLRINPEVGAGTISHTSVGTVGSKFGVSISAVDSIVEAFSRYAWLTGLHLHVGSQGCDLEMLTQAAAKVEALRHTIESATKRSLQFIDIGGGLPAVYLDGQTAPSPADYAEALRKTVPDLMTSGMSLITEFGRAVQAGCGFTVSRVEYCRAESPMAVIHVGADLLMRPVYRPQDWPHEFSVLDSDGRVKSGPRSPLTIAGPLCFSGDIVAQEAMLPRVEPGDWIVIRDTGAYTLGLWSRHCSRGTPAVLGYDRESEISLRVLRPAETPQDIVRFWDA